jgi:chromate transporter
MIATLIALALLFAELSLLAFGGGNSILPEMQRQVVEVHHWMTAPDFAALFALAQAAPGPNMMVVVLIGWRVAGWPGVGVTALAKFGPSSLVMSGALRVWDRFRDHPWRAAIQAGIAPLTVGLVASGAAMIAEASVHGMVLAGIAAATALVMLTTRLHPLWVLAAGALIGLTGIGQV